MLSKKSNFFINPYLERPQDILIFFFFLGSLERTKFKKVCGWVVLCQEGEGTQNLVCGVGAVTLQLSRLSGAAGGDWGSSGKGGSWKALTSLL